MTDTTEVLNLANRITQLEMRLEDVAALVAHLSRSRQEDDQ